MNSVDQLRSRAIDLRSLARGIHALQVIDCHRSGGDSTWVGPSPQRCDDALRGYPSTLRMQADSLTVEAGRLDRIADEIEARTALKGLL